MLKTTSLALLAGAFLAAGIDRAAAIDAASLPEPSVIYANPPQQIAPVRTAYAERSNMGGGFIEFMFVDHQAQDPRYQQRPIYQQQPSYYAPGPMPPQQAYPLQGYPQ